MFEWFPQAPVQCCWLSERGTHPLMASETGTSCLSIHGEKTLLVHGPWRSLTLWVTNIFGGKKCQLFCVNTVIETIAPVKHKKQLGMLLWKQKKAYMYKDLICDVELLLQVIIHQYVGWFEFLSAPENKPSLFPLTVGSYGEWGSDFELEVDSPRNIREARSYEETSSVHTL